MQNSTTALVRKVLCETKALKAEQEQQVIDIADAMREDFETVETVPVVTKPVIAEFVVAEQVTLSTKQQDMLTLACFEASTVGTTRANLLEMAFGRTISAKDIDH
uniref:Uncharacterized protein n=1 Tax=viral metagenome TaxID=1070528 RepID=A0A6C0HLY5_9ZZZZ